MSNQYFRHSRLSEEKFLEVVECFSLDKTADETADETQLERKTVNSIFIKIRQRILEYIKRNDIINSNKFNSEIAYRFARTDKEYKSRLNKQETYVVLVILLPDYKIEADIIFVVDQYLYKEMLERIAQIDDEKILSFGFFEVKSGVRTRNDKLLRQLAIQIIENSAQSFVTYMQWRVKKFKGIKSDKFILHLHESKMRFNSFASKEEFLEALKKGPKGLQDNSCALYRDLITLFKDHPL